MNSLNKTDNKSYIKFANVLKPHGIHGALKINFLPGSSFDLNKIKHVYFYLSDHYIKYKIQKIKGTHYKPILYFYNITNFDDAAFLKGADIFVLKSDLERIGAELLSEYLGATAYLKENGEKKKIGIVFSISKGPDYDYLEIKTSANKEILVPFIDQFVITKDSLNKEIIISNESGFIDDEF